MRTRLKRSAVHGAAIVAASAAVIACGGDAASTFTDAMGNPLATLVAEHSIGKSNGDGPSYELGSIIDVFPARDGSVWVIDGGAGISEPMIRQFDSTGKLVRRAGRAGSGPGEYRAPYGVAELHDGRIAVRDRDIPERVHVYKPDGTFDLTWNVGAAGWLSRNMRPILVDTAGVTWLPMRARVGMPQVLRVAPTGQVIDTVGQPMAPNAPHPTDAPGTMGMHHGGHEPRAGMYSLVGSVAWNPIGGFARARADSYHVDIGAPIARGAQAGDAATPMTTIAMSPPRVTMSDEERAFQLEGAITLAGAAETHAPTLKDIPTAKPPIHHVDFSADGQLMVWVYGPSQKDSIWADTYGIDLFDDAGKYRGRVAIPNGFWPSAVRGDHMWGVFTGSDGAQVVRRYRIAWR
jgi:hypothetical protein